MEKSPKNFAVQMVLVGTTFLFLPGSPVENKGLSQKCLIGKKINIRCGENGKTRVTVLNREGVERFLETKEKFETPIPADSRELEQAATKLFREIILKGKDIYLVHYHELDVQPFGYDMSATVIEISFSTLESMTYGDFANLISMQIGVNGLFMGDLGGGR